MAAVISAHELLAFLAKQAALPLRNAHATPGGIIVILDDPDQRITWALIYDTDGELTEHRLSKAPPEERGWVVGALIKRYISPEIAARIMGAHLKEIIRALERGLALRETLRREHGIEDDWHCQLIRRQIERLERWRP